MQIKINETDEIKTLSIVDDNGIEWTQDLIGNAGKLGVPDGFTWSEEEGIYLVGQDEYYWWANYIADHNATAEEARALAEELGVDLAEVYELIAARTGNDYDMHRWEAQQAMQELREQHQA